MYKLYRDDDEFYGELKNDYAAELTNKMKKAIIKLELKEMDDELKEILNPDITDDEFAHEILTDYFESNSWPKYLKIYNNGVVDPC